MKWLAQISPEFVIGLITVIVGYVHNHSWRKSQAAPTATPPAATGGAAAVSPVALLACALGLGVMLSAAPACHTPKERAVLHAEELCIPADLAALRQAIAAAKQTGSGTYIVEVAVEALACNALALGAKPPAVGSAAGSGA